MAINKNFVVKNGIEVNTNLIVADTDSNKVGIGTTIPAYTLHVFQGTGIGASTVEVTGIGTFLEELNVGLAGTTLTVLSNDSIAGTGGSVGIGTALPEFVLDVRSPVSTGQTALYVQGDVRITGDINIDDISIGDLNVSGISTFVGNILIGTGATVGFGSTAYFRDNAKAIFGVGEDFKIYHDPNDARIENSNGDIKFKNSGSYFFFDEDGGETLAKFVNDGAVELFFDNSKKFETGPAGTITVGVSTADGFEAGDDERVKLGADQDLQLYHDGANSWLINNTGDLSLRNLADDKDVLLQSDNGSGGFETYVQADGSTRAAKLFNSGSVKFETTSSGVIATGINTAGAVRITDNLTPVTGQGLELFCPDTSSSTIQSFDRTNAEVDKLTLRGNPVELKDSSTVRVTTNSSGVINTGITTFSSTSHIKVPSGTTGQRPSSAVAGDFRYNTTTGGFEGYTDEWGAIAGGGGASETDTSVSSTSATSIFTTAHATNRSVSAIIQITQGSSYQVGRYLVIHDGTTATIVEESAVATGDMLGSFTADINGSNLRILVNMASASSATVTILPTVVTV